METGELFGEISFLQNIKTTASIVADQDDVEVYYLDENSLNVLFTRYPALAGRFYKYMVSVLSTRLKQRESSVKV